MSDSGRLFESEPVPVSTPSDGLAPLAERMRPSSLDEVVGQAHLVGPGMLLRQFAEHGDITSLILWGPPGVGKTTLARVLAAATDSRFVEISATASGVKQVREEARAASRLRETGVRTILFVDEIHRFNKAQQDTLLPWVENGSVVLMGATTENPSFEVVAPLLSRARVVRLEAIDEAAMLGLLSRALTTAAPRGLADLRVRIDDGALERLVAGAEGDARVALNTLELAARLSPASSGDGIVVDAAAVEQALQRPGLRYDREEHFNQISALQKSVRNSDADAALYWLARMLEAGEDPVYVARRLIRMASEDVGLADPNALGITINALRALQTIGLPEGALALAQATIYLAVSPKSDSVTAAWSAATSEIARSGSLPVPMQLRNATTGLMRSAGYGKGYEHAHATDDGVTGMECLPDALVGRHFYAPTQRGVEDRISARLERLRQLRRRARASEPSAE
jgi:putative ATPase